jgi:threonine dehydratase
MRVVPATLPLSDSLPDVGLLAKARSLRDRYTMLHPTTLVRAKELDEKVGAQVLLAVESVQVTGSFKVRGALLALESMGFDKQGRRKNVVAASAGNHGAGVAFAANALGMNATIVVPQNAPRAKTDKMRECGATIVTVTTDSYDDAEVEAKLIALREHAVFVSPYDDLAVLAGNGASIAYEIAKQLPVAPSRMIAPFGGGGLATGLACGLADAYGDDLGRLRRVWGAQSEASCAMALSLARGAAVESLACAGPTFAEGLEGGISNNAYLRAGGVIDGVVVVDESSIARAMVWANDVMGIRIEGSAAVGLATLLDGAPPELQPDRDDAVVIVLLTGRNVDDERFHQARTLAG